MEVRIVGSEDELGVVTSLSVFGNTVFRDRWTEVNVTAAQAEKLKGNRFFDVKGQAPAPAPEDEEEAEPIKQAKARLDELGVKYSDNASLKVLEASLDRAEKKKAAADAKAAEQAE